MTRVTRIGVKSDHCRRGRVVSLQKLEVKNLELSKLPKGGQGLVTRPEIQGQMEFP